MTFDKEQVLQFLPHRDPFLFIDYFDSVTVDKSVEVSGDRPTLKELIGAETVCGFFAREELSIFAGHFPGNPILPGVVQVEMMGQCASFTVTKAMENPLNSELEVALLGVTSAKFRKPILPGMDLKIVAKCTKCRGPIMSYDCQVFCGEDLMSEASLLASVKF